MAHYVKFMRGTPAAYTALEHKDSDTLYFICDKDATDGVLYLGNKLIAGGEADFGVTSIDALKDVLITSGLAHDSLLVYDSDIKQWTNKPLDDVINVFIGASALSSGISGLVPAPPRGQTNLFLRSDGTWAPVAGSGGSSGASNITSIVNESKLNHSDVINKFTAGLLLQKGDIIIIQDTIANDKKHYTSYVYDGYVWRAMDGNYNADNVYFDTDFVFTENIGTVQIPAGEGCVMAPAAGKNVTEFFATLFASDKTPNVKHPSYSLSLGHANLYEVGTIVSPSYSIAFDPGAYEYDNETGVEITGVEVIDTRHEICSTLNGTFSDLLITDDTTYTLTAKVRHTDGKIPTTALNNLYINGQIVANDIVQISNSLEGYRNIFYGTFDTKAELTSASIRSLTNSTHSLQNGVNLHVPPTAMRAVIAIPEGGPSVSNILDTNAMNANIVNSWKIFNIAVEGANGYQAINYKVYCLDFAEAYGTTNVYKVQTSSN